MKKTTNDKKLKLNTETVALLTKDALALALGGARAGLVTELTKDRAPSWCVCV